MLTILFKKILRLNVVILLVCSTWQVSSFAQDSVSEWDSKTLVFAGNFSLFTQTYVNLAMYNAVDYIDRRYTLYAPSGLVLPKENPAGASQDAAVISAAYYTLKEILSQFVPPKRKQTVSQICTQDHPLYSAYIDSLFQRGLVSKKGAPLNNDVARGLKIGQQAAEGLVGNKNCGGTLDGFRRNDGLFPVTSMTPDNYPLPVTDATAFPISSLPPGMWTPTEPELPNSTAQPFLQFYGNLKPFLIPSAEVISLDPPPLLSSSQYARDFDEVKAFGSKDSTVRTQLQTEIGLFWGGPFPDIAKQFSDILQGYEKVNPEFNPTLVDRARLFAMTYLAIADSEIVTFKKGKYFYNLWRPETAVRNGDFDGNDMTDGDPNWVPLLQTPYIPDYPSAHCTFMGAISGIAEGVFGTKKINFLVTSEIPGAGPPCQIPQVNALTCRIVSGSNVLEREQIDSRVWAGYHYRTSSVQGIAVGNKVARYILNKSPFFKPIPK